MIFESVIYEEEIDFYETELALERCSYETDFACDLLYCESDNDKSNNKNIIDKFIDMFKTFIEKCKKYLNLAIDKITGRVQDSYKEHKLDKLIDNLDEYIKEAESVGIKSFKFVDMYELEKCLIDESTTYKKIVKKFTKEYIVTGLPIFAEKMVKNVKKTSEEYKKKISDLLNNPKDYSVKKAKIMAESLKKCNDKKGSFIEILNDYKKVCDETESLVIGAVKSLDKYSKDTGYIQNSKALKDILHNTSIVLQTHTAEVVTALVKYSTIGLCKLDEKINTKTIEYNDKNDKPKTIIVDKTSDKSLGRKVTTNVIDTIDRLASSEISSVRKVSRKNDIKNWKSSGGKKELSFDNREITKDELVSGTKKMPITFVDKSLQSAAITAASKGSEKLKEWADKVAEEANNSNENEQREKLKQTLKKK